MLTLIGILLVLNAAAYSIRASASAELGGPPPVAKAKVKPKQPRGKPAPGAEWRALDRDLHAALEWASKRWRVAYGWLHACAHGEGGHGRFVDNLPYIKTKVARIFGRRYDGDGWFQFLNSQHAGGKPVRTWEWMSNAAWITGRGGERPPGEYRRIDSKLGQSYTAAWAFAHGYSFHWFGKGC